MIAAGAVLLVALIGGGACISSYNSLVRLDQGVKSQWGQVENDTVMLTEYVPTGIGLLPYSIIGTLALIGWLGLVPFGTLAVYATLSGSL